MLLQSSSGSGNGLWADLKQWPEKIERKVEDDDIEMLLQSAGGNGFGLWADLKQWPRKGDNFARKML